MTSVIAEPTIEEAIRATSPIDRKYFLGSGCNREVFYIPGSYWAYKIDRYPNNSEINGNIAEYNNYVVMKSRTDIPPSITIPDMHLLPNGILAIQYVEGRFPDAANCWPGYHACYDTYNCFWTIHGQDISVVLWDAHSKNVKISETGKIYVIDLA